MPEPITLAALAINIGYGIAANATQAGGLGAYRKIGGMLRRATPPENHDVLKATHIAYVQAIAAMADSALQVAESDEEKVAARALRDLSSRSGFRDFRFDGEHLPLEQADAAVERLFAGADDGDAPFAQVVIADLTAWGVSLPPLLEQLFIEGVREQASWDNVFSAFFTEQVKTNERAFRILTFERLAELKSIGLTLTEEMEAIYRVVGRFEEKFDEFRRLPNTPTPDQRDVENLEDLFRRAYYIAGRLCEIKIENEAALVDEFKNCSYKMHEISSYILQRNSPDGAVANAVIQFYEAFRQKSSLSVCIKYLNLLKELVGNQ